MGIAGIAAIMKIAVIVATADIESIATIVHTADIATLRDIAGTVLRILRLFGILQILQVHVLWGFLSILP